MPNVMHNKGWWPHDTRNNMTSKLYDFHWLSLGCCSKGPFLSLEYSNSYSSPSHVDLRRAFPVSVAQWANIETGTLWTCTSNSAFSLRCKLRSKTDPFLFKSTWPLISATPGGDLTTILSFLGVTFHVRFHINNMNLSLKILKMSIRETSKRKRWCGLELFDFKQPGITIGSFLWEKINDFFFFWAVGSSVIGYMTVGLLDRATWDQDVYESKSFFAILQSWLFMTRKKKKYTADVAVPI